jgi:hypothetical protein
MKLRNIIPVSRIVPGAHFTWQTTVKGGRALGAALLKVLHLRVGGMTLSWCTATFQFAKYVVRLQRRSGWPYVVKYLKAASVLLQQSASGQRIKSAQELGAAVSRTASGIPRIIPHSMRDQIRSGNIWTVKVWLSFFCLYRVIDYRGKLKLHTITAPATVRPEFLIGWYRFVIELFPIILGMCGKTSSANWWKMKVSRSTRNGDPQVDLNGSLWAVVDSLAANWIPANWEGYPRDLKPRLLAIQKSSPNSAKGPWSGPGPGGTTSTGALLTDLMMWANPQFVAISNELRAVLKDWLGAVGDVAITRLLTFAKDMPETLDRYGLWDWGYMSALVRDPDGPYPGVLEGFGTPRGIGKLGFKPEPAGKIRVFAMVDNVTQCVLKPVHDLLFSILRHLPTDGTFDQLRPAKALVARGLKEFYSFDLSAATDRFPVALQHAVMSLILGRRLAGLWVKFLVNRDYIVPRYIAPNWKVPQGTPELVRYGAGQPMGALTSWAAFSLTHHFLVQYAAYQVFGTIEFFLDYALLGDDIVIAHKKVAEKYLVLLQEIGVEYGLAKSLISSTGGFEFAKRTFVTGKDASPISLLAIGVAKADLSVLEQVMVHASVDSLSNALRIGSKILGYGYRTLARLAAVLKTRSRLQGLAILLSRPGSPWALPPMEWLLQVEPGKIRQVTQEVTSVMRDSLSSKLLQSAIRSLETHVRAILERDRGVGTPWEGLENLNNRGLQGGNAYLEVWYFLIEDELLRGFERKLRDMLARVHNLEGLSSLEINDLWSQLDELRGEIASIPVSYKPAIRDRIDFGAPKRSALIRLWRGNWRLLKKYT